MKRFLVALTLTCVLSVSAVAGDVPTCGSPLLPTCAAPASGGTTSDPAGGIWASIGTQSSPAGNFILTIIRAVAR